MFKISTTSYNLTHLDCSFYIVYRGCEGNQPFVNKDLTTVSLILLIIILNTELQYDC